MNYPDFEELLLPEPTLSKLLEHGKSYIDLWMANEAQHSTPHLVPQIVIASWGPEQQPGEYSIDVHLAAGSFDSEQEKRQILSQLGWKMYDEKRVPLGVMLLSEVWISENLLREDGSRRYLLCEDDPDRREEAAAFLVSLNQQHLAATRAIKRTHRPSWAGEWNQLADFRSPLLANFFIGFFARCGKSSVTQPC